MNFTRLVAYPIFPNQVNIQWEIDNTQLNGRYKFEIFVNDDLKATLYNQYNYLLKQEIFLSFGCKNDYTIKVVCTPPKVDRLRNIIPVEKTTGLYQGLDEYEYNIAREIVRKETLLFQGKIGLKVNIYKEKKFGEACSHCVDELTGVVKDSQCPYCYGTKYGLYEPVELWADIVEAPVEKSITDFGTMENKTAQMRLTNNILLNKRDIIKKENDIIWRVSQEPTLTYYRGFPISQQCVVHALSPKERMYKI